MILRERIQEAVDCENSCLLEESAYKLNWWINHHKGDIVVAFQDYEHDLHNWLNAVEHIYEQKEISHRLWLNDIEGTILLAVIRKLEA